MTRPAHASGKIRVARVEEWSPDVLGANVRKNRLAFCVWVAVRSLTSMTTMTVETVPVDVKYKLIGGLGLQ